MLGHVNEPNKKFGKKVWNFSDRERGKHGNFPGLFRISSNGPKLQRFESL